MTTKGYHRYRGRNTRGKVALVIVLVLGGAFAFSFSEGKRIETEITRHTEEQAHGVTDLLGLTDALIMQQVQGGAAGAPAAALQAAPAVRTASPSKTILNPRKVSPTCTTKPAASSAAASSVSKPGSPIRAMTPAS